MAERAMGILFLLGCTITDCKSRYISRNWCLFVMAAGLFWNGIFHEREIIDFLIAMLPGIGVMILAFITKEQIGYGDGIMLCALAILYSLSEVIFISMLSLSCSFLYGAFMLLTRKKSKKDRIPVAPFLLLGMVIFWCI